MVNVQTYRTVWPPPLNVWFPKILGIYLQCALVTRHDLFSGAWDGFINWKMLLIVPNKLSAEFLIVHREMNMLVPKGIDTLRNRMNVCYINHTDSMIAFDFPNASFHFLLRHSPFNDHPIAYELKVPIC